MKHRFLMPPIPEAERTPLVIALLGVIEGLAAQVQKQEEEIALLKDEIRILKGGKKRPRFKPSKMDERTEENRRGEGGAQEDQRRAGSDKRSKTAELVIHAEQIIEPKRRILDLPRFGGRVVESIYSGVRMVLLCFSLGFSVPVFCITGTRSWVCGASGRSFSA